MTARETGTRLLLAAAIALLAGLPFVGVPQFTITLLTDQLRSVMQLSGVTTLAELRQQGAELCGEPA